AYDAFWQGLSTRRQIEKIHVPVLSFGGWYDNFSQSDLEAFAAITGPAGSHRVVIGPWPHNMSLRFSGVDFGSDSSAPVRSMQLDWLDDWLKGKDSALIASPPVRIFTMGVNEWREEHEWPLARSKPTPFYLTAKRPANSLDGAGELSKNRPKDEPADHYVF